ncbi:ArsR/SmtB family transcription factor [Nitrosopumilus sp.]|uniref:ArsR/SmtB family transcription factor n=1 Tax=Nitrosopumilus sp. TaxID=2024843 RepID=UPI003B5CFEC1
MPFDSLCKKKIFRDVPNLENIKIDKHANEIFSSVFTGMGGRYTRLRILCEIVGSSLNTLDIAKKLRIDYKTVQYNLEILENHNLVVRKGSGYGDVFTPSEIVKSNLPTLYEVIRKVEAKLEAAEKNYIE